MENYFQKGIDKAIFFCYNTNVGIQYYNDAAKLIVDYVKGKVKKLKFQVL